MREIERWHRSERAGERKREQQHAQEQTPWQRYQDLLNMQRMWTQEECEEFKALRERFSLQER